jgi:hypothetical protein
MGSHAGLTLRTVTDAPNLRGRRMTKQNREDKAMKTGIRTRVYTTTRSIVRLGMLGCFATPFLAGGQTPASQRPEAISAKLVQTVRAATQQFVDVNAATAAGYKPFLGCITGPDMGAMGVHYVNADLVSGGQMDATQPQALIYEPTAGGMRLVGVEFIALSVPWLAQNPAPPVLEGQSFQFIDTPNRYGLPALFELHVWAWRDNPNGAFVDWNTHVTCEKQ